MCNKPCPVGLQIVVAKYVRHPLIHSRLHRREIRIQALGSVIFLGSAISKVVKINVASNTFDFICPSWRQQSYGNSCGKLVFQLANVDIALKIGIVINGRDDRGVV